MSESGSGLEDGAEDGAVLGVVGVGSGGGDEEGRDAERGVADGEIDDVHAGDGGDVQESRSLGSLHAMICGLGKLWSAAGGRLRAGIASGRWMRSRVVRIGWALMLGAS